MASFPVPFAVAWVGCMVAELLQKAREHPLRVPTSFDLYRGVYYTDRTVHYYSDILLHGRAWNYIGTE